MVTAGTRDAALGYQWLQIVIPQLQTTELTLDLFLLSLQ